MAMQLNSTDAHWQTMRSLKANSVSSDFVKIGNLVNSDALNSAATTAIIVATAHGVVANDFVMFFEGGEESEPRHAESVNTDLVTLGPPLSGTPSEGEGFVSLTPTASDLCEATTTDTILKATGHTAIVGNMLWMIDGGEGGEPRIVDSVAATTITLNAALSGTPSAGEGFAFAVPDILNAACEATTTDTVIVDADNVAVVGDIFVMTTGGEINEFRVVTAASAASFTLNEALSGTPTAAETYSLWNPTTIDAAEAGQSTTRLFLIAHNAIVGDQIIMTSGGEVGEGREVSAIATDYLDVSVAFSDVSSPAETLNIERPVRQSAVRGGFLVIINNNTNQTTEISYDGTNIHHRLLASGSRKFAYKSNNLQLPMGYDIADDATRGYIWGRARSTIPTTGELDIEIVQ